MHIGGWKEYGGIRFHKKKGEGVRELSKGAELGRYYFIPSQCYKGKVPWY